MKFLITGGCGFIGSALIRLLINKTEHHVINIDALTYSGNLDSVASIMKSKRYFFERANICDLAVMTEIFAKHKPDIVIHLAAESHVDRSISGPSAFIESNIIGTYTLLEVARRYWGDLSGGSRENFRFHHVSTDEVYGDLDESGLLFNEETPYAPSSPYSASKASSDHLVRAWYRTYGLPVVITNCSNNYGPYQFPEKLIPLTILNALDFKPIPVYGNGSQIRDWLYVEDHARALVEVATKAAIGETYNIGGHNEKTNIEVVELVCRLLDEQRSLTKSKYASHKDLVKFVADRPGHDRRYAIDASKIQKDLGWVPAETFESGLRKTVVWYLSNYEWRRNTTG